jgi:hypothetical protein
MAYSAIQDLVGLGRRKAVSDYSLLLDLVSEVRGDFAGWAGVRGKCGGLGW